MALSKSVLLNHTLASILHKYPFLDSFFENNDLDIKDKLEMTVMNFLDSMDDEEIEDRALDADLIVKQMMEYIDQMITFLGEDEEKITSITILPGTNKSGDPEKFEKLVIRPGDIICIVGPTGSGKSRLLADIEWVAQKDTPTSRTILINDNIPDKKWRFSSSEKLVAQLSQNMNFVMDLTVTEFLQLHAESRMVENQEEIIVKIINQANKLAGEQFAPDTPITSLSGGQSRALMIADTAILSKSPIVLIDEIENAGIDRKKALKLLLLEDKIVFMATHDPMLALMGNRRIVIKNGGINKVIDTTDQERIILKELEELNKKMFNFRTKLRQGEILNAEINE
ncbi:ATP-binding cassette domain-containing protein [bacterium]|nr:ATP-binding cassette domain-containing protein [bacterium]